MVFDHVGFGENVHTYIQSFHMPLFFILSGYLWKKRPIIAEIRKKSKTLLLPYFSFGFIYTGLKTVLDFGETSLANIKSVLFFPTDAANFPYNPGLWYLYCAFIANILFSAVMHIPKRSISYFIILVLSSLGTTFSSFSNRMLPFAIEPVCVAILFMLMGYIIKQYPLHANTSIWIGIALVVAEFFLAYCNNGSVDFRSARYNNPFIFICNGLAGTLGWWIIFEKTSVGIIANYASFIAKNGIVFICINQFLIRYINRFARYIGLNSIFVFALTWIICIIICRVSEKTFLKVLFGK